jgi:hypothetical protein
MILYYALGGGLGHLTRGRRVLEALGLTADAAFVTASPYAHDRRITGGIPVIRVPEELDRDPDAHRAWLRDIARGAERILVDTFPCGIQGELSGLDLPPDLPLDLVARLLRWDAYRRAVPAALPRFDTVWRVEPLAAGHEAALRAASRRLLPLDLTPPAPPAVETVPPYWLIVHSGPEEEVQELVSYAEELRGLAAVPPERILVASRCHVALPGGFTAIDVYPATPLFPAATRIISAAGFNIMLETEPWRARHHPLPFPRPFDDQYRRAARGGRRPAGPTDRG